MLNKINNIKESKEEGFTLIELLVVIIIIGVLAAIALPIFMNQQKAAIYSTVKNDVRNAVTAVNTYLVKNPTASNVSETEGPFTDIMNSLPKSDNVSVRVRATATGVYAFLEGIPTWDSYAIKGVTTFDTSYWYVYESTKGKYREWSY